MQDAKIEEGSITSSLSSARTTNYRWVVMTLAFIIIIVCYMDRTAIAWAAQSIKAEYHMSDSDLGFVMGAFGIGYAIMTLGGGIMIDLWGARKVWAWSAAAWSSMTALLGIVSGLWPLFFVRTMLGITEGPCFPALTRVVTDWLPMSERARATAFGLTAVPLASVVGAKLITGLIAAVGWKAMFLVLSSLGIVWAVVWAFAFRDYPENSNKVSPSELSFIREGAASHTGKSDSELRAHHLGAGKTTWKFMLFNPALMSNNWAFFSFGYLLFFAIHWLPEYMRKTYGSSLGETGNLLVVPWLTAAVMLAFAGWFSDYLWKRTGSFRIARSHLIWICQLLSAVCFIGVINAHSLNVGLFFLSLGLGFGLMPNACFYSLNSDLAGDRAGTSLGLMDCFAAGAAVLAPIVTGKLVDVTGNFESAIWLMVGLSMTAVISVILFQHPDKALPQNGLSTES